MSKSKRQYFPQDADDETFVKRSGSYQELPKNSTSEKFRKFNPQNLTDNSVLSKKKIPGSFARNYAKEIERRRRSSEESNVKKYSRGEKIKFIKEYESTGAPVALFCKWYGIGINTFRRWLEKLNRYGIAGLDDMRISANHNGLPDGIKAEIIRVKLENPGIGPGKISQWLSRHKFFNVGSKRIRDILLANPRTEPLMHEKHSIRHGNSGKEPQHFERSKPGEMYQMDIMTFMLQGLYRVYVIACLDDYSRFVVSCGLFRRQTTDRCLDVLRSAIERYGMPKEMLTDNGRQFYTWRGTSEFQKFLVKCGIRHIRSRPYHPQTLGKIESLWRNMYQEFLGKEPLSSFEDAEAKIEKWIEWYNFRRPHQGIGGLVPADRFFGVDRTMRDIMAKGAGIVKESLAADPRQVKQPVYLVGNVDGKEIRIIAKDGSVTLDSSGEMKEVIPKEGKKGNSNGSEKPGTTGGESETGRQIAQEDKCRKEVCTITGNSERQKNTSTGAGGAESEQADDMAVAGESQGGAGICPENNGTGAEEKRLCSGQRTEEGTDSRNKDQAKADEGK